MSTVDAWLLVLLVAVVTFAAKAVGPVVAGDRALPAPVTRVVVMLASALLSALVVSSALADGERLHVGADTAAAAGGRRGRPRHRAAAPGGARLTFHTGAPASYAAAMLYMVQMTVRLPPGMDPEVVTGLKATEKERALDLQRDGRWCHLWRVAGAYANVSIFDVADHDELHGILSTLPLFPYMDVTVTPLAEHPSALSAQD